MPDDKPKLDALKKAKTEAPAPVVLELNPAEKVALFNAAFAIYEKQRPEIKQGAPPVAPKNTGDSAAMADYAKAVQGHLRTAQEYAIWESKALWLALFRPTPELEIKEKV